MVNKINRLYVTTDAFEAETLIENTAPSEEPKYNYQELKIKDSLNLVKTLGFNPMTSVDFSDHISPKALEDIAIKLVKKGLFVAVDSNGAITEYIPNDIGFRDGLTRIALRKKRSQRFGEDPCCSILAYSNKPDIIRKFNTNCYN
jgi:hypothetical protein